MVATAAFSAILTGNQDFASLADGQLQVVVGSVTTNLGAIASASTMAERAGQVVAAINNKTGTTGVFAFINSGGRIALQSQSVASSFGITGAGAATFSDTIGIAQASATVTSTTGVSSLSVQTYSASQVAIALVDNALSKVNTTRATLGAVQSRFESAVASQQTTSENLAASRSRIQDADFASETANLAKAQILQQSGIAMLAQANAIPQNVLALLQ